MALSASYLKVGDTYTAAPGRGPEADPDRPVRRRVRRLQPAALPTRSSPPRWPAIRPSSPTACFDHGHDRQDAHRHVGDGGLTQVRRAVHQQVGPGDTLDATATVTRIFEENGEKRVAFDVSTVNQNGQEVLKGSAEAKVD